MLALEIVVVLSNIRFQKKKDLNQFLYLLFSFNSNDKRNNLHVLSSWTGFIERKTDARKVSQRCSRVTMSNCYCIAVVTTAKKMMEKFRRIVKPITLEK